MILATCQHHNLKPYTFQSEFRIVYCCLVCRVRLGRSFLKAHGFAINLADSDKCLCGKIENSTHYLLDCVQFTEQRNIMIESMAKILPNFTAKTKSKKVETLLQGINLYQDDPDHRNKQIAFIAQNYILNTGRFSEKYSALEAAGQQLLPQPNS